MYQEPLQDPIAIEVENASTYVKAQGFTPSLETINQLKTILNTAWNEFAKEEENKEIELIIPKVIELIAISQFEKFRADGSFSQIDDLKNALWLTWRIFERWLKPRKPKK